MVPISVLLQTMSTPRPSKVCRRPIRIPIVSTAAGLIQVVADGGSSPCRRAPPGDPSTGSRHGSRSHRRCGGCLGPTTRTPLRAPQTPTSPTSRCPSSGGRGARRTAVRLVDDLLPVKAGSPAGRVELTKASSVALLDAAIHLGRLLDSANPRLIVPAAVAESVRFAAEFADPSGRARWFAARRQRRRTRRRTSSSPPRRQPCVDLRGLRFAAVGLKCGRRARATTPPAMVQAIDWQPFSPDGSRRCAPPSRRPAHRGARRRQCRRRAARRPGSCRIPDGRRRSGALRSVCRRSPFRRSRFRFASRTSTGAGEWSGGLAERDDGHPATLWIVTRGVREAVARRRRRAESAVGHRRESSRAEQPQLWGGLVDMPAGDITTLPALSTILLSPSGHHSGAA